MGCCGIGWGCSARHEGLVVPARLVETSVGVRAQVPVVVTHDQLVGLLVDDGHGAQSVRGGLGGGGAAEQEQGRRSHHRVSGEGWSLLRSETTLARRSQLSWESLTTFK